VKAAPVPLLVYPAVVPVCYPHTTRPDHSRGQPNVTPSLQQLGIDRLSVAERVELIGLIWDSINEAGASAPIPEWHIKELERRVAAADANPEAAIPWEVVKARLTRPPS
jgi:putative addiction module component (TIGR02574 family)